MTSDTRPATSRQANPWAALAVLSIGFFMIMVDTTIVNVAIPSMLKGLHASLNQIVWVNSVYLLTYAVPLLLSARLGDRIGRKQMFIAGLVLFTGASLWCAISDTPNMLIAARAVQGFGAAAMGPQTMAYITNLFPPAKRGVPMGIWGAVAGIATIAGPLLGGVLVINLGWQWIFMVNVPIGVVGLVLAILILPATEQQRNHRFDILGTVLLSIGLLALVFGVQNGQLYDWGKVWAGITIPEIIGAGVVFLVAFVIWQWRNTRDPLLPLSLFANRDFAAANIANITIGFAMTSMFLPLVIYLQSVLLLNAVQSGLTTIPMSIVAGFLAPVAGRLSDKFPAKYVATLGFVALAAGTGLLAYQLKVGASPWTFVPALALGGFGVGCVFSPLANLATGTLPMRMMGAASGVFNSTRQIGGVLGVAAVGVLLQARLTVSMHNAAVNAATALPPNVRDSFVNGMAKAAKSASNASAGTGGCTPPAGVPAQFVGRVCQLGAQTFDHGYTDAAKATLILPAAVLAIGAIACITLATRGRKKDAPTEAPVSEPVVA
jgi:EmrB/QacA subfamily drug resistance transporter